LSKAETVIVAENFLSQTAIHGSISRSRNVLDEILLEHAPYSIGDQNAREHCVYESQVRVLIIKRSSIDRRSIHDIFNANGPATIIIAILLVAELQKARERSVYEGGIAWVTHLNELSTNIQVSSEV
jgi:hypothetical protein